MSTQKTNLRIVFTLVFILFLLGSSLGKADPVQSNDIRESNGPTQPGDGKASLLSQSSTENALIRELLAKAAPDECYAGIGNPYPPGPPCELGVPKVNQAYVWGLAKAGDKLWFGTAPNVHCLVFGSYLSVTTPHETDSWVCEFGQSQYSPPLPDSAGDWRPPHIYVYDLHNRTLTEKSPAEQRFYASSGIRSAGTLGPVVILGGPSLTGGINLFAYLHDTGEYLGSTNLPAFTNIRKWLVVDGVLYTAVRNVAGGGNVLRWQGDENDPFQFEIVGNLDSEGAELAYHEGRIYVSTWPNLRAIPPTLAGLYMSPIIPEGGLTASDVDTWQKVWQANEYEPDPVTAATYGGGALASFDGYLYWGTMHVPFVATLAHINVYGAPQTQLGVLNIMLRTHRAISIFRGRDFGTPSEEVTLLYGEKRLSVYNYDSQSGTGGWELIQNNMNTEPLWGGSGFGYFYNNYTWTMGVYRDHLFVGTMDWSYLFRDGVKLLIEGLLGVELDTSLLSIFPTPLDYGADLFRFSSSLQPAIAESLDGIGNYSNYGIRTMIPDDALYLGTANPMNLMTSLSDDKPEGGWELLRLVDPDLLVYKRYLPQAFR